MEHSQKNKFEEIIYTQPLQQNVTQTESLEAPAINNNDTSQRIFLSSSLPIISLCEEFPQDEELNDLLKEWKMEHLYDFLRSEKITVNILKILRFDHVQELMRNFRIGDRALFEYNFENWRSELEIPLNVSEITRYFEKDVKSSSTGSHTGSLSRYSSTPYQEREILTPEPDDNKQVTLFQILRESRRSTLISEFYKLHNKLDNEHRNLLISVIANYFEDNNIHMSLKTSYRIEKEIVDVFPNEKEEFYRTDKSGKIYIKFCNLKQGFKTLSKKTKKPKLDEIQKGANSLEKEKSVPTQDIEAIIQSLKYDNLTADEFESLWQSCSNYRINQISKECSSMPEIFKLWPEYKKPTGYRLIDKDFGMLFKDYEGCLANWESKLKKIYTFLKKDKNVKDSSIKSVFDSILKEDIESESTSYIFKTLWCLHGFLYPTTKIIRKDAIGKSNTTRFTIKDSQESFIFVGQTKQQLEDHIEFLKKKNAHIQPFILTVANAALDKFDDFYIYLDGTKIQFNNLIRCIDICFKTFYLFNLEYPKACYTFWNFMETFLYNLPGSSKKNVRR